MFEVRNQLNIKVIGLDYKGDGIAFINNFYIFTPGLLKDEEAIVEIISIKKGYAMAKVIKMLKTSNDRISSTSMLGSIKLSHLKFSEQLKWQQSITKETLDKVLKEDLSIEHTITDSIENHYRNKVVYHTLYNPYLNLALYANDNKELVVVNEFLLAPKIVNKIVTKLNSSNIIIKNKDIINIAFKVNSLNEVLVTLVSNNQEFRELVEVVNFFKEFINVKGITLNLKKHKEKILSNKSYLLYGTNVLNEGKLLLSDQSFLQVNSGVANLVYKLIKDNIVGTNIVDAYSGIGSIGFSVYSNSYKITMIENNLENVKLANLIKTNNNFHNVDIVLANAEDVIKEYRADTIILDPARKGLQGDIVNEIISNKVKRVIYLSCDLQTLARDLKGLSQSYKIVKVYPIKMFPQTNAFETLVILDYN